MGEALADEAFWRSDPVLFVQKHREQGFKFTSDTRESADSRLDGGVSCFGIPVYESRVLFSSEGGIARVELVLFNRGGTESIAESTTADGRRVRTLVRNDKTITREGFLKLLNDVRGRLTAEGAKNPVPVAARVKGRGQVQKSQTWPKTAIPTVAGLTWNYSQDGNKADTFKPGFVRLAVDGPARLTGTGSGRNGAPVTAKGKSAITDNVIRDPRGDVFVDNVPMVDQGAKGYCAAAAAERVLRYYGVEVDEHEIAEAAGTTADEGTSSKGMKDSVDAVGRRYRLATMTLFGDFEKPVAERIASLTKDVANYNKAAKKLKKPAIDESVYVTREGNTIMYNPMAADAAMDAEVLKDMKVNGAQKSKYKKFMADVHQYVNAGVPLFWSVTLGTYPETDLPQAKGGHMRLIIGYNDKRREILYSDTWGKGHELKRMPADWAWTISRCLMAMKPLK
ncbi:MAG: C39 family peptidase [Kiritimatiellae bacterium]|nr:C39 family peptidase [Kiritimatiellia bacterium]